MNKVGEADYRASLTTAFGAKVGFRSIFERLNTEHLKIIKAIATGDREKMDAAEAFMMAFSPMKRG